MGGLEEVSLHGLSAAILRSVVVREKPTVDLQHDHTDKCKISYKIVCYDEAINTFAVTMSGCLSFSLCDTDIVCTDLNCFLFILLAASIDIRMDGPQKGSCARKPKIIFPQKCHFELKRRLLCNHHRGSNVYGRKNNGTRHSLHLLLLVKKKEEFVYMHNVMHVRY